MNALPQPAAGTPVTAYQSGPALPGKQGGTAEKSSPLAGGDFLLKGEQPVAFTCPACHETGTLAVELGVDLPADSRSDEINLQVLVCTVCGFRAIGVYEESRRGALDNPAWNHCGYSASPSAVDYAAMLIRACPQPSNPACACSSHCILGRQDPRGTWAGLDLFAPGQPFNLDSGN